jgi:hypothetical protein
VFCDIVQLLPCRGMATVIVQEGKHPGMEPVASVHMWFWCTDLHTQVPLVLVRRSACSSGTPPSDWIFMQLIAACAACAGAVVPSSPAPSVLTAKRIVHAALWGLVCDHFSNWWLDS